MDGGGQPCQSRDHRVIVSSQLLVTQPAGGIHEGVPTYDQADTVPGQSPIEVFEGTCGGAIRSGTAFPSG